MEPTATGGALPVLQTLQNGYILPAAMEPTATRRCFIYAPRRLRPRRVSQIEFCSKEGEVCEQADHPATGRIEECDALGVAWTSSTLTRQVVYARLYHTRYSNNATQLAA